MYVAEREAIAETQVRGLMFPLGTTHINLQVERSIASRAFDSGLTFPGFLHRPTRSPTIESKYDRNLCLGSSSYHFYNHLGRRGVLEPQLQNPEETQRYSARRRISPKKLPIEVYPATAGFLVSKNTTKLPISEALS